MASKRKFEIMETLDDLVGNEHIKEHDYNDLAKLLKCGTFTPDPQMEELRMVCPIMFAATGDLFEHHTRDANNGEDIDLFMYVGRSPGTPQTPAGRLVLRHLGIGRGICQEGSNTYAGCNGGMRDACGAWPLDQYHNYHESGRYNDCEMALPAHMCWGFRKRENYTEHSGTESDEEPHGASEEAA